MPSYGVLIIDDHSVVADSVAALVTSIRSDLHIEISHSLKNAQTVLLCGMVPSLIVTDLLLPDSQGVGTAEQIFQQISHATGKTAVAKAVVFSRIGELHKAGPTTGMYQSTLRSIAQLISPPALHLYPRRSSPFQREFVWPSSYERHTFVIARFKTFVKVAC
jgi:CheY-like chemotaxis protein